MAINVDIKSSDILIFCGGFWMHQLTSTKRIERLRSCSKLNRGVPGWTFMLTYALRHPISITFDDTAARRLLLWTDVVSGVENVSERLWSYRPSFVWGFRRRSHASVLGGKYRWCQVTLGDLPSDLTSLPIYDLYGRTEVRIRIGLFWRSETLDDKHTSLVCREPQSVSLSPPRKSKWQNQNLSVPAHQHPKEPAAEPDKHTVSCPLPQH